MRNRTAAAFAAATAALASIMIPAGQAHAETGRCTVEGSAYGGVNCSAKASWAARSDGKVAPTRVEAYASDKGELAHLGPTGYRPLRVRDTLF